MTNPTQRTFLASIQTLNEATHTADIYIMNTSPNRNDWGVNDKALEEALPTIKGAPIGMGNGYQTDKHYPDDQCMDSGKFTAYQKPASYALATAQIDDPKTWSMMKTGELGPVSVVIDVYKEQCSVCGEDLAPYQAAWHDHTCIKEKGAYSLVSSFKFHRVDYVDVPAYPQAGILDLSAEAANQPKQLQLCASFYESQNQPSLQNKPNVPGESTLTDTPQDKKIADLEAANKKLETDLKAATEKATANETTVQKLQAQLDTITKTNHDKLVDETFTARIQAGIAGKAEDEKTMLAAQTDTVLQMFKADAEKTATKLNASENKPKAQYQNAAGTDDKLLAAVNEQRNSVGLPALKELY